MITICISTFCYTYGSWNNDLEWAGWVLDWHIRMFFTKVVCIVCFRAVFELSLNQNDCCNSNNGQYLQAETLIYFF